MFLMCGLCHVLIHLLSAAGFVGSQLGQDTNLFVTVSICRLTLPAAEYALFLRCTTQA